MPATRSTFARPAWLAGAAVVALAASLAGCQRHSDEPPRAPTAQTGRADAVAQHDRQASTTSFASQAAERLHAAARDASLADRPPYDEASVYPPVPETPRPLVIPLTLSSPMTSPFPVSSGIPLPRGLLTSTDHLQLQDEHGLAIPAQWTPLATWPDGTIKSVLLSTVLAPGSMGYTIRELPEPAPPIPPPTVACEPSPDGLTVSTGPMRFRLAQRAFTVFDQVWINDEPVLTGPGDLVLIDQHSGEEYRASQFGSPHYAIDECGPVRAVITATGELQSAHGDRLTAFIVRLTAYAGQAFVQMDYTLVDPRPERDVDAHRDHPALEVRGYGITLPVRATTYAFGGEFGEEYRGNVEGEQWLYQRAVFRYVDGVPKPFEFDYTGVATGAKAAGWLSTDRATVCVRDFWQQGPKELDVRPDGLTIWLHPPRASDEPRPDEPGRYTRPSTFYFPREGGAKTYQVLLAFHPSAIDAGTLNASFQAPRRLLASREWYANSGVFGRLLPAGPETGSYDHYLIDNIYAPSVGAFLEKGGGYAVMYGWRDYGDRLRPGWAGESNGVKLPAFYNDTHVGAHVFFLQYLRTQDQRWWDLAEVSSRHWMDIDVSHTSRSGYWKVKGNLDLGPGEGYLIKHEMIDHDCRNLHQGHAHLSGLADYYLLTGDRRALDVIREVGTWWVRITPSLYGTPVKAPHYAEAERDYAWPLFVMNEAYRATGDTFFLEGSAQLVRHLIQWWQLPADHYVNGRVVGHNDWTKGTGWWTMYPKSDNTPDPPKGKTLYNGTNPWMAGALISSTIQFYEYNRDARLVDHQLIKEMLLQTTNYVVKYGWETSHKWKPYDYFVYSEAGRDTDGGLTHIVFPLAYLGRLLQRGEVSHREWYDTSPQWLEIADKIYHKAGTDWGSGTTSTGFYGYETIWPSDFFALMQAQAEGR